MDISLDLFTYPFEREGWGKRMLIGGLLVLGGLVLGYSIVLMPLGFAVMLPLFGYSMRVMRQTIRTGELVLPEWTDWGDLFKDGLRYLLVSFIYMLPVILLVCVGYGVMFGGMFALTPVIDRQPDLFFLLFPVQFGGMAVIMIGMLLSMALGLLLIIGITRMVALDSLNAAFEFGEVWALVKKGWKAFGLAFLLLFGLWVVISMVLTLITYTICLACFVPFLMAGLVYYLQVITSTLFGLAYREVEAGGEPTGPAGPTVPAGSGEPVEPAGPAAPVEPVEPAEPGEPSGPDELSEPDEPSEADESSASTDAPSPDA